MRYKPTELSCDINFSMFQSLVWPVALLQSFDCFLLLMLFSELLQYSKEATRRLVHRA